MPNLKIILLGDMNVGKTSFIRRYLNLNVHKNQKSTVGAAMFTKCIEYNNNIVYLNIWDTAGQERYSSLNTLYYRSSNIAIVMYDITNPQSFITAKDYLISLENKGPENIIVGLIGNKNDVVITDNSKRAIPFSVGKELADTHCIFFAETNSFNHNDAVSVFGSLLDLVPNDIIYSYTGDAELLLDKMIDNNHIIQKSGSCVHYCCIS